MSQRNLSGPAEYKRFPFIVTKIDEVQGIVTHSVAVLGNIDLGDDIIHKGAFTKTIRERMGRIRVLDNHQRESTLNVVGIPLKMWETGRDELPLEIKAQYPDAIGALMTETKYLLDTPEGLGVFLRIKEGAISEYSIGFDIVQADRSTVTLSDGTKMKVRNIREVRLYEYSPVIFAMNQATSTVSVKNDDEGDVRVVKDEGDDARAGSDKILIVDFKDAEDLALELDVMSSFFPSTIRRASAGCGVSVVYGLHQGNGSLMPQAWYFKKGEIGWTPTTAEKWYDEKAVGVFDAISALASAFNAIYGYWKDEGPYYYIKEIFQEDSFLLAGTSESPMVWKVDYQMSDEGFYSFSDIETWEQGTLEFVPNQVVRASESESAFSEVRVEVRSDVKTPVGDKGAGPVETPPTSSELAEKGKMLKARLRLLALQEV